jgi:glycosyltransferase involved in cell wall biosynthesis
MNQEQANKIAILHYSAPPVIGGVESVILAHTRLLLEADYQVTVLAGRGDEHALPEGTNFLLIPELDSQQPEILRLSEELEQGRVPIDFEQMALHLQELLAPTLLSVDTFIVHNVFTKHFNLPLTAALFRLLDANVIKHCIAWCHDLTWTSPHSRSKVFPGYPWDLLRTQRADISYVAVSQDRQHELANLFGCELEQFHVIYNGVDPEELLALSDVGRDLIDRLNLWDSNLNLLMPVRVTQAKNIELAIHVMAALQKRSVNARLVVTGPPDPHDPANMDYFRGLLALREELRMTRAVRFVYESGPTTEPFHIEMPVVAELLRFSDALFLPSHREGFGMPILEAGLVGIPVFCADHIPAANELGKQDVIRFSSEANPDQVADLILQAIEQDPSFRLRQRVRRDLTWRSIFQHQIEPLIDRGKP